MSTIMAPGNIMDKVNKIHQELAKYEHNNQEL
jgi:hypothetical protein